MLPSLLCASLLLAASPSVSRPFGNKKWSPRAAQWRNLRRDAPNTASCGGAATNTIQAPQSNIFLGLTNQEAADVTSFLHAQPSLNLSAASQATDWDNVLQLVELLQPNKSDALTYLDSNGLAPVRYARARIAFGAREDAYVQEFQVGPLPVKNGTTSVQPLRSIFNNGSGRYNAYNIDQTALVAFYVQLGQEISDITQLLFGGMISADPNATLVPAGNENYIHEDGRVYVWHQVYNVPQSTFISTDILPTGLEFKLDLTGRDPSKWKVVAWWYNNLYSTSLDDFRQKVGGYKTGNNNDGNWTSTDQAGASLPRDDLYPPVEVTPDGPRYGVDPEAKYVEWMDFSFFISFNRDVGVQLYNIKYKGKRIIYELALQEAAAHYASADPFQSTTSYLDSSYGMGLLTFELVPGFDCPIDATFLNVSVYQNEITRTHPNAICMFEHNTAYPLQRHLTSFYVSSTQSIVFTLRSAVVAGNYDYIFDYEFHLDGSIFVTVRASGYIQAALWVNDPEYGFKIHDALSGSLHDHVLNYKLDLDVDGTANSVMQTKVVPTTESYPWDNGKPRDTMKIQRSFVQSESDSKLDFSANSVDLYAIVNTDKPNEYGEFPGWRLMPQNTIHATMNHSTNLGPSFNWAYHDFYVVKHKDSEPRSAYPFNGLDTEHPVVDFDKFFDGDSLEQEDLVVYFNLGMHHLPHTGDLPNTVTTTARSTMAIIPQNYLLSDPSRQTVHQVRLNLDTNSSVAEPMTFGARQPTCAVSLAGAFPDLTSYSGEVIVPKFPYDPTAVSVAMPGAGLPGGGMTGGV